jgi:diguanylate cyclase (GGDEF)-like protein/PAS domain S-box-containing protein
MEIFLDLRFGIHLVTFRAFFVKPIGCANIARIFETLGVKKLLFNPVSTFSPWCCDKTRIGLSKRRLMSGDVALKGSNRVSVSSRDAYRRLRAKQVDILFDQLHVAIKATLAAALMLVVVLWSVTPAATLLTWFAIYILQIGFRLAQLHRYRYRNESRARVEHWLVWFILGVGVSGMIWGASILLLVPEGSALYLGFVVLWVCGLSAGSIASLSVVKGAFFAFALPALLPAAAYLVMAGDKQEVTVGAALLLFLGFISLNSIRMHKTLVQSFRLQFSNEQLISRLDAERARVENLNEQLERRISAGTSDLSRVNIQLQQEIKERQRAEQALRANVRHLEHLSQITMVMGETFDPDELLTNIISKIRMIFNVDRTWLLYPCDLGSKTWRIPVEATVPAYPGLFLADEEMPVDAETAQCFTEALNTGEPVIRCPITSPTPLEKRFSVLSTMNIALRPQYGKPWLLGLHQCSYMRPWTEEEEYLFKDIACRLASILDATHLQRKLKQSEERLRLALKGARVGLWDWNIQTGEAYFSPLWQTMLGFKRGEIAPNFLSWKNRIHPEDVGAVLQKVDESLIGQRSFYETEFRLRSKDRSWVWIQARGEVVKWDKAGKPLRAVGTHTDISQRKQTEEKLKLDAVVFENTSEGVIITDTENRILAVNKAFTEITGYEAAEMIGKTPQILYAGEQCKQSYSDIKALMEVSGHWQGEIWNRRKQGEIYPQWSNISQVKDENGRVSHYVYVFTDITILKESQDKLEHLAHHDPLTNLPNRLLFSIRLEHALARCRREGGKVAVLFFDLDRFKHINDSLGHPVGDQLLICVSERLRNTIREEDAVARLSGDEFMVLLEGLAVAEDVVNVAKKTLQALAKPFDLNTHVVYITCSIGISLFPDDAPDSEILLKNADTALYRAKDRGRNSFQFFTKELTVAAKHRVMLESSLRHAIEDDTLELFYQPQVSLSTDNIVGAEALVRWQHPQLGLLTPERFLPVAEETGIVLELGNWVLHRACTQAKIWQQHGLPQLRIAVNISPLQVARGGLLEIVQRVLEDSGLEPCYLELEITEGLLLERTEQTFNTLNSLTELGVSLAIDDFGKGYSSLNYLKRFNLHTLKIDQSFIQNIPNDSNDMAIVRAIIALAKSLRLNVIAEGVETRAQQQVLRAHGCDQVQGFLFAAPVEVSKFMEYVCTKTNQRRV